MLATSIHLFSTQIHGSFWRKVLAFYLGLPSRREMEMMLQSSQPRSPLPIQSPLRQPAKQLKTPARKGKKKRQAPICENTK